MRLSHWQKVQVDRDVTRHGERLGYARLANTTAISRTLTKAAQIPLEAIVLIIAKLEEMRNEDDHSTRFEAQADKNWFECGKYCRNNENGGKGV